MARILIVLKGDYSTTIIFRKKVVPIVSIISRTRGVYSNYHSQDEDVHIGSTIQKLEPSIYTE